MTVEEWREIPGFPGYEVSRGGEVRSWRCGSKGGSKRRQEPKTLVGGSRGRGYRSVLLYNGHGIRAQHVVHRLVAMAFLGLREGEKLVVHHRNGDRSDNRVGNLEVMTQAENNHPSRRNLGVKNLSALITLPCSPHPPVGVAFGPQLPSILP